MLKAYCPHLLLRLQTHKRAIEPRLMAEMSPIASQQLHVDPTSAASSPSGKGTSLPTRSNVVTLPPPLGSCDDSTEASICMSYSHIPIDRVKGNSPLDGVSSHEPGAFLQVSVVLHVWGVSTASAVVVALLSFCPRICHDFITRGVWIMTAGTLQY